MMLSPILNRIEILKQSFQIRGKTRQIEGGLVHRLEKQRLCHNWVVKPAFLIMTKTVNHKK